MTDEPIDPHELFMATGQAAMTLNEAMDEEAIAVMLEARAAIARFADLMKERDIETGQIGGMVLGMFIGWLDQ